MDNPIAFNPLTMTVEQLRDIANAMRDTLNCLDQPGHSSEDVVLQLRAERATWLRKWGPAK